METPAWRAGGGIIHLVSDLRAFGSYCAVSCNAQHLPVMWGGEGRAREQTPLLQRQSLLLPTVGCPGAFGSPCAMGVCKQSSLGRAAAVAVPVLPCVRRWAFAVVLPRAGERPVVSGMAGDACVGIQPMRCDASDESRVLSVAAVARRCE